MAVRSLSLNTKLVAGCMLMLGFSLVLSVSLITIFGSYYWRADQDVRLLTMFNRVMVASNKISAERAPVNSLLGTWSGPTGDARANLDRARSITDEAIADILKPIAGAPNLSEDKQVIRLIQNVTQSLAEARHAVDALAARPATERSAEDVAVVLQKMFDTVDLMRPFYVATISKITSVDDGLAGTVLVAQMLSELREQGGRLISQVRPFVAAGVPLTTAHPLELATIHARLIEIWQLAGQQAGLFPDQPELETLRLEINVKYFGSGLELIDTAVLTGQKTGNYGISSQELSERYAATMRPIEDLRTGFLRVALDHVDRQRASATVWLIVVSIGTLLMVAATVVLIVAARHYVLRPLMVASGHVVALSNGEAVGELSSPAGAREMLRLFDALEGLRIILSERELHRERLKVLSETDGLTGLLNRRLFDRIGHGDAEFDALGREVSVIMMDLDYFKDINDSFGHLAGDQVLQHAATIVQRVCRKTDLAARYGGEEIAIIILEQDQWGAMHVAERIRAELEAEPVVASDGRKIHVTASFGVAHGRRGGPAWQAVIKAADAALYQAKATGRNRVCRAGGMVSRSSLNVA